MAQTKTLSGTSGTPCFGHPPLTGPSRYRYSLSLAHLQQLPHLKNPSQSRNLLGDHAIHGKAPVQLLLRRTQHPAQALHAGSMANGGIQRGLCLAVLSSRDLHPHHVGTHATCPMMSSLCTVHSVPFTTGTWQRACLHVYISINTKPGFPGNQ